MSDSAKEPAPGWKRLRLADIVGDDGVFSDGDWVESKDQDPEGDVRLIQLADVGDGEYRDRSERFLTSQKASELGCTYLKAGDILVARMPDPLGRACIFPGDKKPSVTVVDVAILRPGQDGPRPRWLSGALNSPQVRQQVAAMQAGTTRKRISRSNLGTVALLIPPREEQDRIAAEIDKQFTRLDAGVEALKRLQAHLRRYRAAVLKAACEGTLLPGNEPGDLKGIVSATDYLRAHEVRIPAQDESASLPAGWAWTSLADLKSFSLYGPRFSSDDYRPEGRLVLRTSDISESGKVNTRTAPRLPLPDDEFHRYRIERGDLLITRTGSLGTLAVFDDDVDAIPGAYLIQYRLKVPFSTSRYIFMFLKSPLGQAQLVGGGAGVGRPNLNAPTIEAIQIPLPPPTEQDRILMAVDEKLSQVAALETCAKASLGRATRLRAAVLQVAFEGRLVDPVGCPESAVGA